MEYGSYLSPTNKQPFVEKKYPTRIAVIMATFVRKGKKEFVGGRHRNKKFVGTDQEHISFEEDKLELIQNTLAFHKKLNPGISYDLVIVDNSTDDEETRQFLEEYSKERGIRLVTRPNTGFSFGAYNYAYKQLREEYDYFLFHEQDILPIKHNWLKEIVDKFMSSPEIGAVGNVVEALTGYRDKPYFEQWRIFETAFMGTYWDQPSFRQCNLDGMFMFTSTAILDQCGLQVFEMYLENEDYESWNVTPGINELFWQHPILNAGYTLASFHDGKHLFTHGICYLDFEDETLTEYPPMMHGQTLLVNPRVKKYIKTL